MADMNEKTPGTEEQASAPSKNQKKASKKPNIFVRFGRWIKRFFRDYISEMKKVVWLSKKDTFKSSLLVTVTVLVTAIVIGLVDAGFSRLITLLGSIY